MFSSHGKRFKILLVTAFLCVLLLVFVLFGLHLAWRPLTLEETVSGLLGTGNYMCNTVVREINGPRIAMGCFVGAGLGVSGAAMQAVFRNPMASPYTLGLSSGASFGAAFAIMMSIPFIPEILTIPLFAFIFCFGTMLLVYSLSKINGRVQTETLLLSGIAVSAMFSAFVSFLTYMSGDKMAGIVFWTMGNLGQYGWKNVTVAVPLILIGCSLMLLRRRELNAMMVGDIHANDLGVDVARVRKEILFASSLVTAACVSFCGIIGFVGLVIPHIIRILLGPDNRILMPLSMLGGAAFLVMCDCISRCVIQYDILPIGIITAVIGAPYFIYLLRRRKNEVGW